MTTTGSKALPAIGDHILDLGRIYIEQIPDDVDVIAELKKYNSVERTVVRGWTFTTAGDKSQSICESSLEMFIHGDRGGMCWVCEDCLVVPVDGTNPEDVPYLLGRFGNQPMDLPVGAEVPVEQVYAAVAEFIRTKQLPTYIQWREEPDEL